MTARTDLDGKLRAWLDLMPDEAPDRAVAAVLDAIEASPQAQARLRWPTWRSTPMIRAFVAVAAAITIVVAGAAFLLRPVNQPSVGSSSIPSIAPTEAPSAVGLQPVPDSIIGVWMGSHRSIVAGGAGIALRFTAGGFTIAQSNDMQQPVVVGQAGLGKDQRLQIRANVGGCSDASFGVYNWALSPSGRVLTVAGASDPCGDRGDAVAGTYWRMGCLETLTCLGPLDAGGYASQFVRPLLASSDSWAPKFGALTYTVRDGWANDSDGPATFGLTAAAQDSGTTNTGPSSNQVDVMTQAAAESTATPCSGQVDASVPVTAAAIADAIRGDSGLIVGPSMPITIDGRQGVRVDLALEAGKRGGCGNIAGTFEYLMAAGIGQGINPGERQRLILLDVGPGNVLAIRIQVHDGSAFDAFAAAAMPVVESMQFQ